MKNRYNISFISLIILAISFSSCNNNPLSAGYEFMPNMYRSPSLETYGQNNFFIDSLNARIPVKGTIPRGYIPFEYGSSIEQYLLAGETLENPIEINDDNLLKGQQLYGMFCAHCHGENGNGKGSITHPLYSAIPAYYDDVMIRRTGSTMSELKAGNIYHAIYYGLNAMGPHNSQLNENERWLVTAYVQKLQQAEN